MSEIIKNLYEVEATTPSNDFIGFTFNGCHSSQLGIVRTSDGSRFNESLLPTMQDKTVQVPGGDGTYYFGSYYTQRQFNIQFAFDDLTEQKFADLKRWLGDKQVHELIFDETPYKTYQAKVTGSATMKYIPFEEGATNRVYKGEGSVQFTAYQPYAKSTHKWLSSYCVENERYSDFPKGEAFYLETQDKEPVSSKTYYIKVEDGYEREESLLQFEANIIYYEQYHYIQNIKEWLGASRIRDNPYINAEGTIINYDELLNDKKSINLYNAGDIETHFQLVINFKVGKISSGKMYIDNDVNRQLAWSEITAQNGDTYIKFNSKLNLIEGYNESNEKTGNIYNQYISEGTFFKIPLGDSVLRFDSDKLNITGVEYDYYYI